MIATMIHRGPDDEGLQIDREQRVALGVRRLAVIDVAGGHQPLSNEDGSVWVAFNGEIYNHAVLRERLLQRGHSFRTGTDTEILTHLYEELGEDMPHALDGMFSFAIWDTRRARLLLVRDRFGEKPLFLHEHSGELSFASELTALLEGRPSLRELDPAAIDAFFVFGYVPGPSTIVPGIRQLLPGHLLSWQRGRAVIERSWWSPPAGPGDLGEPLLALAAEAGRLFKDSVRTRMIADVPVGVFLSGGIDSTLVAAAAADASSRPLKTFTVGYDVGSFDETSRAREVARRLQTEHHEVSLTESQVAQRTPGLLARLDQPLGDQALVPLHALSEFAKPLVTVALGGEGADELFGGYPRYRWLQRASRLESMLPGGAVGRLGDLIRYAGALGAPSVLAERIAPAPLLERHLDWVTRGRRHDRPGLYGRRLEQPHGSGVIERLAERAGELRGDSVGRFLMRLDQIDYLPDDVLMKTDRAGMRASLEIRSVYLQRDLADLAASVNSSTHTRGRGKRLLHEMLPADMSALRLPGHYRKTAFRAPAAEWLRGPLAPTLNDQTRNGLLYAEGYFDRAAATARASEHLSGAQDHSHVLWPLLALGLWVDRFLGRDAD